MSLHVVNGLLVPSLVTQEHLEKLRNFQLYTDDVWIITYPKCGTTWTQQIVRLLRDKGEQDDVKISTAIPWLEGYPELDVTELPQPRAFKSHYPYHLFPCGPPHATPFKYISVMRNPKDMAVSFYYQMRNVVDPNLSWEGFWKMLIERELPYGDYFDHILSWWPHRGDKNVLVLKYEDMKNDLPQAVSRIASLMDVTVSSAVISKVADLTRFDKMKDDNTANFSWRQREGATKFLRKGIIGDWMNHLTAEQSAQMDAICTQRLKDTGLVFEYES